MTRTPLGRVVISVLGAAASTPSSARGVPGIWSERGTCTGQALWKRYLKMCPVRCVWIRAMSRVAGAALEGGVADCAGGGDIPTVGRLEHVPHLILGRRDVGVGVGGAHPPQASHCARGWGSEMPGGFAICPPRPTKRPPASRAPPARPCTSFHRSAAPPEAARAGILQRKGERGSFPHRRRQPGSEQLPIGWSHRSA